jgi:hypothetical protein
MNERIRQLARDSHMVEVVCSQKSVKVNYPKNFEKFAELIVRECMAQCEQVAEDADAMAKSTFVTDVGRMIHEGAWGGAKNCGAQIQTHFGVEQ